MLYRGDELKVNADLTLNELSVINSALAMWHERMRQVSGAAKSRLNTAARLEARTHIWIGDLENHQAPPKVEG